MPEMTTDPTMRKQFCPCDHHTEGGVCWMHVVEGSGICDWCMKHCRVVSEPPTYPLTSETVVYNNLMAQMAERVRELEAALAKAEEQRDHETQLVTNLLTAIHGDGSHHVGRLGWDMAVSDAEAIVRGDRERIAELEDERIWLETAISAAREILSAPEIAACFNERQALAAERILAGPK